MSCRNGLSELASLLQDWGGFLAYIVKVKCSEVDLVRSRSRDTAHYSGSETGVDGKCTCSRTYVVH